MFSKCIKDNCVLYLSLTALLYSYSYGLQNFFYLIFIFFFFFIKEKSLIHAKKAIRNILFVCMNIFSRYNILHILQMRYSREGEVGREA